MKIRAKQAGLAMVLLFVAGIGMTMLLGYWETESTKEPIKYTTGEFAGKNNPADIRGSYSFGDIEKAFDIPVATLAKAYGFTEEENPGESFF